MNYFWDDRFHLFRRTEAAAFGYSDGLEIEHRLLNIILRADDRSTFSTELAESISDWPSEYHLSRSRHCLVRPLGIKPGDTVLELGCGCGAVTRYLGESGATVVAVEGSLLRARIAAERCRDLSNVTIYSDDLLRFEVEQTFDWVLLIGVLEYAPVFSKHDDPIHDYLSSVRRFLSPTGKVVIATENKLGLKYFNGCSEDHLGVPFLGTQGLYKPHDPTTFGRRELSDKISLAGYTNIYFYYPFPDYKLPSVVISESAFSDSDFDAVDLLARSHGRDYTGWQYRGFDEALAVAGIAKNGLLQDLSNSFLVVAAPTAAYSGGQDLAVAFSAQRVRQFATQTSFRRVGESIRVVKEPLAEVAERRLTTNLGWNLTNVLSDSPYVPGRQLLWRLLHARARSDGGEAKVVAALLPWFRFLLQCAETRRDRSLPGPARPTELASFVIGGRYLDCTPFNLIEQESTLTYIDNEWDVDAYPQLGWVVTRAVQYALGAGVPSQNAQPSIPDVIKDLCTEVNLSVGEPEISEWLEQEAEFQTAVTGRKTGAASLNQTSVGLVAMAPQIKLLNQAVAHHEAETFHQAQAMARAEQALQQAEEARAQALLELNETRNRAALSDMERAAALARASELESQAGFFRDELFKATHSRSWRLTRPLRSVTTWARRQKARVRILKKASTPSGIEERISVVHGVCKRLPLPAQSRKSLATWMLGRLQQASGAPGKSSESIAQAQKRWDGRGRERLRRLVNNNNERISFPAFEVPAVSIILVFYNKGHLSLLTLESLIANADVEYEVVIVDNSANDETDPLLNRIDGARILRNSDNVGFGAACMQGAAQARGKYLCFLNNDVLLEPNAFSAALANFDDGCRIGAVGGKILLANGDLQEAGSIVWSDGSALGYGRADNPNLPQYEFRRPVDYCSGAFLFTPRELFNDIGGFDQDFFPAYYEDADYCMRLWSKRWRVVYEPRAVIRHYESASSGGNDAAQSLMAVKQRIFLDKWKYKLGSHLAPASEHVSAARIAASSSGLRILYIDDRIPHCHLGSGYPRSYDILRQMVKQGHHVTCATFTFSLMESEYADIPRDIELYDGLRDRDRLFREYVPNSDLVWVSRPHNMESFLEGFSASGGERPPLVYDAEAIFAERDLLHARVLGRGVSSGAIQSSLEHELSLAKAADAVVVVSQRDRKTMTAAGLENVYVIGHQLAPQPTAAEFDQRGTFLFVGAMHGAENPNLDSMQYFLDNIWPYVRRSTGADFVVAGYGTDAALSGRTENGVHVLGQQGDLTSLYNEARVFVVPTRYAAGIPFKAQEAAAFGVPLVASTLIADQLGWKQAEDCLVAESAPDFADACCRVFSDRALWERLRSNALLRVQTELTEAAFTDTIASVIAHVTHREGLLATPVVSR